jgi:hypothetical protein
MKIFLKSIFVLAIIGGIILGYIHEVPYFTNTFEIKYLFFRSLLLGVAVGSIVGWVLSKKAEDKSDRAPIIIFSLVAGMAVFPLLGISSNHIFAKTLPLPEKSGFKNSIKVIFQKEEPLRTSRFGVAKNTTVTVDAFYLYFAKDGKIDRIRTKTQSFKHIEAGQEIELPIKQGFWGFTFVDIP